MRLLASIAEPADEPAARLLGQDGFFSTPTWWRTVLAAGIPAGATPVFAVTEPARHAAMFALLRHANGQLEALTTPYTCLYQPMHAHDGQAPDWRAAGAALARLVRGTASLRLDALDPGWPGLTPLLAGARAAGLVPLRFAHFGNWHEDVAGVDWQGYLARRPGALRETIRRRVRSAERDKLLTFDVIATPSTVAAGIAQYEDVYARSWKEPEPFPQFNAELMRRAAGDGVLRLGILRHDDRPIAVQLWIVHNAVAMVLKLAHDEAFKPISPGTVLTAFMIRRLLEQENLAEIDFGRGDDPYKQSWTSARRQRIGVILANPYHPGGLALLARHLLGRARAKARQLTSRRND